MGLMAVPRLAPSTSAKATCGATMWWLARDMTSTTTATLEWAAQVNAADSSTAATGWVDSASRIMPSMGAVWNGWNSSTNWCRDSSSSPRPMKTRPRSRVRPGG